MTKHILERNRDAGSSAKSAQYLRIETAERPHPQSTILQKQPHPTDTQKRAKRFLDIDRKKGV